MRQKTEALEAIVANRDSVIVTQNSRIINLEERINLQNSAMINLQLTAAGWESLFKQAQKNERRAKTTIKIIKWVGIAAAGAFAYYKIRY